MSTEPVGLARDLPPQGVMRAQIGQTDLAIWRSSSGVVSAWENRCPHRGMRLSHGFVRGDSLACAYHGWHYNCAGACHYIPAHPTLEPPSTIKPIVFSVVERSGILWVSTQNDAEAFELPTDTKAVRTITLHCDLDTALHAFTTHSPNNCLQHTAITRAKVVSKTPNVVSLSTETLSDAILILLQQPDAQRVACHVMAKDTFSNDELIQLSRWCDSVQRIAE